MNHPFTHRPVSSADADRDLLRKGIAKANIPALLLVLYQMTGEERWLNEPYTPKRSPGLDDNDSGQLPENIQNEIRDAASTAIDAWLEGRELAVPRPDNRRLA